MPRPYKLVPAPLDTQWDAFVAASPQGSLFAGTDFLAALNGWPQAFYCRKNDEIKAAVLLFTAGDGSLCSVPHDLVIYHGVLHAPPAAEKNPARIHSEQFAVMEFIAAALMERFETLHLALHPAIEDIRPFLWVNYHNGGPRYQVHIRYTSYLDIREFTSSAGYEQMQTFRNMATLRRRELRRARREGVATREARLTDELLRYHRATLERQQIQVPDAELAEIRRIIDGLLEKGQGRMFAACDVHDRIGSIVFFGQDRKRAYYLFGAGNPENRNAHTGTAVFWDAFEHLAADDVTEVDFEGVNSPRRGAFKLGFGGDLRTYYWLEKGCQPIP